MRHRRPPHAQNIDTDTLKHACVATTSTALRRTVLSLRIHVHTPALALLYRRVLCSRATKHRTYIYTKNPVSEANRSQTGTSCARRTKTRLSRLSTLSTHWMHHMFSRGCQYTSLSKPSVYSCIALVQLYHNRSCSQDTLPRVVHIYSHSFTV